MSNSEHEKEETAWDFFPQENVTVASFFGRVVGSGFAVMWLAGTALASMVQLHDVGWGTTLMWMCAGAFMLPVAAVAALDRERLRNWGRFWLAAAVLPVLWQIVFFAVGALQYGGYVTLSTSPPPFAALLFLGWYAGLVTISAISTYFLLRTGKRYSFLTGATLIYCGTWFVFAGLSIGVVGGVLTLLPAALLFGVSRFVAPGATNLNDEPLRQGGH